MYSLSRITRLSFFTASMLTLALLDACTHTPQPVVARDLSRPPQSVGFDARIRPQRQLVCILDADLDHNKCQRVAAGARKLNVAARYELLLAPIDVYVADLRAYAASHTTETTYIASGELMPGVLGVTYPGQAEARTGYLGRVVVIYSTDIWADNALADSVVLHELFHSIGAMHAAQDTPYTSVERPGWVLGATTELTPADVYAIQCAYPIQ